MKTSNGLWPTPVAYDATPGGPNNHYKGLGHKAKHGSQTEPPERDQLTLFAEASLASHSPMPASAKALTTTATYGRSSPESLAKLDPDGFWLKMYQGYCQADMEHGLERFCETWPRSGTMRNGTAYRLPPLVRLTGGTGSGLLPTHSIPTPTAQDHIERTPTRQDKAAKFNPQTGKAVSLDRFAVMYPTPHGFSKDGRSNGPSGNELGRAVNRMENWPTPTAGMAKTAGGCSQEYIDRRKLTGKNDLAEAAVDGLVGNGSLNPSWVEWLMGFPPGYTEV